MFDMVSYILRKDNRALLTRIQQGANLPHDRAKQYLEDLAAEGLVAKGEGDDGARYTVTEKGMKFWHEFRNAEAISDAFGIRI